MTKINALVVGRNEEHRWLQSSLTWNSQWFDRMLFFDDQSEDNTLQIASKIVSDVVSRSADTPSFLEDESQFRQAAWDSMQTITEKGDWVFVIDCDEFLIGSNGHDARHELQTIMETARSVKKVSARIRIPEVWGIDGGLQRRVDGYWNTISSPRFVEYKPGTFDGNKMGCQPVPSYAVKSPLETISLVNLLHFGYADSQDREEKYRRYTQHGEGHSSEHVKSIMGKIKTVPLSLDEPEYWRGVR